MGLLKRMAANHRARVAERQKRKASRRAHKTERKEAKYDAKNNRQALRLRAKYNRVKARLEKRGSTQAEQDERDLYNAFPYETEMDNYGGGYDSGSGSFQENTEMTPVFQYDNEPNYVAPDYDVSDYALYEDEDDADGFGFYEEDDGEYY